MVLWLDTYLITIRQSRFYKNHLNILSARVLGSEGGAYSILWGLNKSIPTKSIVLVLSTGQISFRTTESEISQLVTSQSCRY